MPPRRLLLTSRRCFSLTLRLAEVSPVSPPPLPPSHSSSSRSTGCGLESSLCAPMSLTSCQEAFAEDASTVFGKRAARHPNRFGLKPEQKGAGPVGHGRKVEVPTSEPQRIIPDAFNTVPVHTPVLKLLSHHMLISSPLISLISLICHLSSLLAYISHLSSLS